MKKKSICRVVATMLAMSLVFSTLCGCGRIIDNIMDVPAPEESTVPDNRPDGQDTSGQGTSGQDMSGLMENFKTEFEEMQLTESYQQPMLNLPEDYVFEFDCSEATGMYYAQDAFKVYNSPDLANAGGMQFNWNTYENGKITVAPYHTLYLTKEKSSHCNDGTWGTLNELYLVQYIDLETGETLEKPIVTPFTVEHDLQAPVITQGVDENNCYRLTWEAVPGAVEYVVYEHFSNTGYTVEYTTTETTASADAFITQKESDELMDLFYQDLEDAGYPAHVTERDGVSTMNRAVKYDEEMENGYFVVVAFGENGEQSGTSNVVNVRDIANQLPYQIIDTMVEVSIETVEDAPAYVDVEMVDGSTQQMIIDYHGAQVYIYPDDPYKTGLQAHVANTLFNNFFVVLSGMTPEDVLADSNIITEREDELLSKIGGTQNPEINVTYAPSEELTQAIEQFREEMSDASSGGDEPEPSEEPSEEPSDEPSEEPDSELPENVSEQVQLMNEVKVHVENTLAGIGEDRISDVFYAGNDLEAWMAMCLIAQSEVVPVPIEVFPDAANANYATLLLVEAYRQNPICGALLDARYDPEYQAFLVEYAETPEERFEKMDAELDAAYALVDSIIDDGMSDYEKVLAINENFRMNASYDYDSTATGNVAEEVWTEQFIDSHTPYGILCENYGVCESYSEAFVLVARIAGLDAVCEVGTLYGGGHEWNRVKVDGSWCVLDITNNDVDIFSNALFNVTDEQIKGILVPNDSALIHSDYYAATDPTKEYYYVNGWSVTDLSQADDILAEQLQTSDYAAIRIPADVSKSELKEVLKDLMYEHEINYADAGAKLNLLCVVK